MTSPSPRASYRLQLGPSFGFDDARRVVPYLDRLGISHVYLSPIWKARSASTHNYDVVDPTQLDPRLGPRSAFDALAKAARERGMGLICDVVPNHMAASHENPWWWDVLSRGPSSPYAELFDIDWERGGGKIVLPILGDRGDAPWIDGDVRRYHEHVLPLDDAFYQTVDWRTGEPLINYRRFFDITDLVATKLDAPALIDETHRLVFELALSGAIAGLRVDHIDGLSDPAAYLAHLSTRLPTGCFVLVEKILARDEELPAGWATIGTTGYEHADHIEAATVDRAGAAALRSFAVGLTGAAADFEDVVRGAKRETVTSMFAPELDALTAGVCARTGLDTVRVRDGLIDATVALRVYRTYVSQATVSRTDHDRIDAATAAIADVEVRDALRRVFASDERDASIVERWQQLCAPAEAKGVEDTALYRDVALVSRNEVGGDPGSPALERDAFHAFNESRLARWPSAMNGTSTHDTKRGEDVRARIDVLAQMSDGWIDRIERWTQINGRGPDPWAELLLYQTLAGTWPITTDRLTGYLIKAAREAKLRTDWRRIDEGYERELTDFIVSVVSDRRFVAELEAFTSRVAEHAAAISLARLIVKATAPGFPDLYQGAERWYLRLVDPDNRAPVDFAALETVLDEVAEADPRTLVATWPDGRIKTYCTMKVLALRRAWRSVFASGDYIRVEASGAFERSVIAFARRRDQRWVIACVPRSTAHIASPLTGAAAWEDTTLVVPGAPRTWRDALTGRDVTDLRLASVFEALPVAVLTNETG